MTKTPSRILNERVGFMGLSIFDLGVIGYTLILTHAVAEKFGLELLAFPFTGIIAFALISIRMTFRQKVIRDFLKFKISKQIGSKGRV